MEQQPVFSAPSVPEQQPSKKSKKKLVLLISSITGIVVLAVIIIILVSLFRSSGSADASAPYIYKEPKAIGEKDEISLSMNFKPNEEQKKLLDPYSASMKRDGKKAEQAFSAQESAVRVFSDKGLTNQVSKSEYLQFYSEKSKKVTLKPRNGGDRAFDALAKTSFDMYDRADERWRFNDIYYVVQYLDSGNGKKLEKPIVYPYTVKHELEAPKNVVATKDEKGHLQLKWDAVEGAESYYVIRNANANDPDSRGITRLSEVKKTEWNSSVFDDEDGWQQNLPLLVTRDTEDSALDKYNYNADTSLVGKLTYTLGVIAVKGKAMSSLATTDNLSTLLPQLPYMIARNAAKESPVWQSGSATIDTIDQIPENMPMTTVDGRTVLQPLTIDVDNTKESNSVLIIGQGRITTLKVATKLQGTIIARNFQVEKYDAGNIKASLANISKRNQDAQVKTGTFTPYNYLTKPVNLDNAPISRNRPSVDYPVFASNPTVDYIAANIIKGNEYIDVSKFDGKDATVGIDDALQEALAQNPYIMYVRHYQYYSDRKILVVEYDNKQQMLERQKLVHDKSKEIIASIIKPGMSDADKVRAINKYMIDSIEYNYEALGAIDNIIAIQAYRDSWTAYGGLFDKNVVCGGYAITFQALAKEAGLNSVYINGTVSSPEGHAWNGVLVDGKWRVIDTTWNDSKSKPNQYLMLTEEQTQQLRKQTIGTRWMSDIYISRYAAI